MWNIESLNMKKIDQSIKRHTTNQSLLQPQHQHHHQNQPPINNEATKSPIQLYNTPNKAINLHSPINNCFPFDFTYFHSNNSSGKQALHLNGDNSLYSNCIDKRDFTEEQLAQYFKSNQSVFKTLGSDLKAQYLNPQMNNVISKKNLITIFENAKNDSNALRKEKNGSTYDKDFLGSPPRANTVLNKKNKKIFECSGSTTFCTSHKKKRRFRKNMDQVKQLIYYYKKNSNWSKELIKEISEVVNLNENKVYKWLWDQKNKQIKKAKFIIINNPH